MKARSIKEAWEKEQEREARAKLESVMRIYAAL